MRARSSATDVADDTSRECIIFAPMPLLTIALLALQAQAAPLLEIRVGNAWLPWYGGEPASAAVRQVSMQLAVAWTDSMPGFRAGEFDIRTADRRLRNSIAVVDLDPARYAFTLGRSAPDARRTVADWLSSDSTIVLAANTGLFRADGTSQGLVAIAGRRWSALAGWLDAVVAMDRDSVWFTDVPTARGLPASASAFQTLPFLVREGRVVLGWTHGLRLSRTHRDRRITLCLGDDGMVRLLLSNFEVFGVSAGSVPIGLTIPEQAALAAGAGCRHAVALDGGISSQIAFRTPERVVRWPGWRRVPLVLLVRRR